MWILYALQFIGENFYMTHLFFDNFIQFIFAKLFRNHFLHAQVKDNGIFFSQYSGFEHAFL